MKLISPFDHNDNKTLREIAYSNRVNCREELRLAFDDLIERYHHYREVNGNAKRLMAPLPLPDSLAKALRRFYESRPADLNVIKDIKNKLSPDICPMCGSLKSSQVDHVIPKEKYPEYAIYTRNLVPACDCNTVKRSSFRGSLDGQRVLHPYFDKVLKKRLVYIQYSGDLESPDIDIAIRSRFSSNAAVVYHVDMILRKTNLINWSSTCWVKIISNPCKYFFLNSDDHIDVGGLRAAIRSLIKRYDADYDTPNNWQSMVLSGLLYSTGVADFLYERIVAMQKGEVRPDDV